MKFSVLVWHDVIRVPQPLVFPKFPRVPKDGAGAAVGVGILRGGEIPSEMIRKSKFFLRFFLIIIN